MYTDALKLISSLVDNPEIENIYFLKFGKISIKFKQEKTRTKQYVNSISKDINSMQF